jgi:hypothetical protein
MERLQTILMNGWGEKASCLSYVCTQNMDYSSCGKHLNGYLQNFSLFYIALVLTHAPPTGQVFSQQAYSLQ